MYPITTAFTLSTLSRYTYLILCAIFVVVYWTGPGSAVVLLPRDDAMDIIDGDQSLTLASNDTHASAYNASRSSSNEYASTSSIFSRPSSFSDYEDNDPVPLSSSIDMTHPTPVPEPDSFNSRCGDRGNMDTICSPKPSQNWKNGSWHQIQWNPSYPSYAQASSVNIYLYYVENYHSTLIKNWSNVSPSQGEYAVQVDDSWFLLTQETKNSALIYLLPSNMDPATELQNRHSPYPKPVSFFIENASIGSNPQTNQSSAEQTDNNDNEVLRPWAIALIVLASIAATVALAVLLCLLRQVQRRKQLVYDEKDGGMVDSDVPSIAIAAPKQDWNAAPPHHISGSINPPTFSQYMASSSLVVPDSSTMYLRPQSTSNISSRSEGPPLTSNEAIMLADSFRQQMRQPDWQRQPQAQLEDDSEQRRRTLSEELLKKELAAEGTLMKKVGKRAHMLSSIQFQDQQQQQEQVEYQYQRQQDETVGDSSSVRRARSRSNSSHHSSVIQSK